MALSPQFQIDLSRIGALLDAALPSVDTLDAAMRHAVLNGGKRLRAHLVYASARLHNVPLEVADHGALAIELMHAYSLVHDDLPSMDDDDLRRGQPTVHKKWNEATAILAGDALQSAAFAVITKTQNLAVISDLATAAIGMVRGQQLDLAAETAATPLTLEAITHLQNHKTGDLIAWAARFGPTINGESPDTLEVYARNLGLAFQIHDDVLDVQSTTESLGKTAGKDTAANKATYVSLLGLDGARQAATEAIKTAITALEPYGDAADDLRQLAQFVITRDK